MDDFGPDGPTTLDLMEEWSEEAITPGVDGFEQEAATLDAEAADAPVPPVDPYISMELEGEVPARMSPEARARAMGMSAMALAMVAEGHTPEQALACLRRALASLGEV